MRVMAQGSMQKMKASPNSSPLEKEVAKKYKLYRLMLFRAKKTNQGRPALSSQVQADVLCQYLVHFLSSDHLTERETSDLDI